MAKWRFDSARQSTKAWGVVLQWISRGNTSESTSYFWTPWAKFMTPHIYATIKDWIAKGVIPSAGRILDVGSRNVNGSPRDLFPGAHYTGIDVEAGPGVDIVMSSRAISAVCEYDLVLCLEMLEHDTKPWETVENMRTALKQGGRMVISVPTTGFPEHKHPVDLFRYMPDAFPHFFFDRMKLIELKPVKCPAGYPGLIGIGEKP